jgi:membrane fusion protein (multidrug efflux system)
MKQNPALVLFFIVTAVLSNGCGSGKQTEIPPPRVKVVKVIQKDIPVEEEFVGQTYGLFDIALQARVEGFLESMHFEEGRRVHKGQLLYTIDPQPFEAKVSGYQSQLAEARTMLTKAESDLARIKPLAEINAVSQSDLDAAVAQRDAAKASVEAAEASLSAARIELGYTKIYSPIDGVIGKTEAYPGDFVGRGTDGAVLNAVSRIDTILVNFHLPETKYLEISRPLLERPDSIRRKVGEARQQLKLILADGSVYDHTGRIRFVNRQVNPTTGTILLQAAFPNPNGLLRPGQFARVVGITDMITGGLLVPQRCVSEIQGTYRVYVVGQDSITHARQVQVGPTYKDGMWIISSGLSPGESVIYEGLQQVKDSVKVIPEPINN